MENLSTQIPALRYLHMIVHHMYMHIHVAALISVSEIYCADTHMRLHNTCIFVLYA